ncbi:mRNA-degrading endonuclease toxin of MazEF toxin-antitoxin module [Allocatelliglobosispora scoriae]|uniref:mRNA-degrading endonuclease toxin of MazEF toxin-antitoxin module n=1 Tax=Allocatelliglobosispora scoriae TaxID=643052 RepID=A0A841BSX2_9ACTN|nr:type II toxin-antitoxin system PemK/MazF family toxin [Allocatelliglobosispora scoriae]MBB5872177.1 mRNA-degrading endonuclease toxin of MazEF toxin-antitoxin module [Allocatelliglobosispora scoriae]
MFWWVVGILVVALAAVYVVARLRKGAPSGGRRPVPRPPSKRPPTKPVEKGPTTGPQPGEIWWADVPYEDGTGHKVRPCLVVRNGRSVIEVLKITSQDQSDRQDHVRITTKTWDPNADHDSYLDLTDPIPVQVAAFEDRAGTLDAPTWQKVRKLHSL